jgi:hypothetical protein
LSISAVHFGQPFEGRAVLDENAPLHQRARRHDLRHRHGQSERARARDDQHRNRDHQRMIEPGPGQHPSGKRERGKAVNRRGIEPRGPVGDAHIARARLSGGLHQPRDLGQRGILANRQNPHVERRLDIERTGMDALARPGGDRRAFAGQQRAVETAGARHDHAIGSQPFARRHAHDHARRQIGGRHPVEHARLAHHHRAGRGLTQQGIDPGAGAVAHHRVERAARQQEQQQHQGAVEPGLGPVGHRFIERERGRQRDPDGDRHVHVGPPAPQRAPRRSEERTPGINNRRNPDERGKPVEQVARGAPAPDHTLTDNSMTFMQAKPATASGASRGRTAEGA